MYKAFDGYNDVTSPVEAKVVHYFKLEDAVTRKKLKKLFLIAMQSEDYNTNLTLTIEAGYKTITKTASLVSLGESGSWDVSEWDKVLWDWVDTVVKEIRIGENITRLKVTIEHESLDEGYGIYGFAAYYKIKKPRGTEMASLISRLYDFIAGTKIRSSHVDEEFNQLVSAHNSLVSDIGTIQGENLASTAHESNVANPHSVTKTQVGLGNVDNTSDTNKPVSTLQAASIATKVDKVTGRSLILDTEITRLSGIATGAEVNVQSDWNQTNNTLDDYIKNKPTLGTVASKNTGTTSGTVPLIDPRVSWTSPLSRPQLLPILPW